MKRALALMLLVLLVLLLIPPIGMGGMGGMEPCPECPPAAGMQAWAFCVLAIVSLLIFLLPAGGSSLTTPRAAIARLFQPSGIYHPPRLR
jgi:hypothetical protein